MHLRFPLGLLLLAAMVKGQQAPPDPSLAPIEDVQGLPRVLLIGDSISMGYTLPVRAALKGKANVHRIPGNGGPTTNGTAHVEEWVGSGQWDVITFNFGLHDLKIMENGRHQVSLADYENNLTAIAQRLKRTGAKVLFITTTPVPEGQLNPVRHTGDVPLFNGVARKVMEAEGIPVVDLYSFALARLAEIQRPVNVHFTEAGSAVLAGEVAAAIGKALPAR